MRVCQPILALALVAATPTAAEQALGEILVTPTDSGMQVQGVVVGLAEGSVEGTLEIDKSGPGGVTKLKQGQNVTVSRGSRHTIGTTGLSLRPGASVTISLIITSDGQQIAASTMQFGQKETDK